MKDEREGEREGEDGQKNDCEEDKAKREEMKKEIV